jgi:phage anti-repressor protein
MQTNNFEELLPIEENQIGGKTVRTVSAKNLYRALDVKKGFSGWINYQLERGLFDKSVDFEVLSKKGENPKGGRPTVDYILTLNTAKEIAMMTGTKKGKEIRNYFIQVEETFLQIVSLKTKAEAETTLFQNLNNLDAVFDDLDKLDTTLSKLEKITKRLYSKSILELYRMNKFTLKVLNFSIFEFKIKDIIGL